MPTNVLKEFENPENKSLKDLFFNVVTEDGVRKAVCALDKHWAPRSIFSNYTSLVVAGGKYKTGAALQEWQHVAENVKNDLEFLLGLKHHEFWSYMFYQKSALNCVLLFFKKATPYYINSYINPPNLQVQNLYTTIFNLAIAVILRLLTRKETEDLWLKSEDMQALICNRITVSVLLDILLAVGNFNSANFVLLKQIFKIIISIDPKYIMDLKIAIISFHKKILYISIQTYKIVKEVKNGNTDIAPIFNNMLTYTLNSFLTIRVLFDVSQVVEELRQETKLITLLYKTMNLMDKIAKALIKLNKSESELFDIDQLKAKLFWSYMVFQKSALGCVVSFLQKATPFYINICAEPPSEQIQDLYETLLNLTLRIICRLLTPKESVDAWLKKEDMRELIYKNYLISVPMLFDLLVAVGNATSDNSAILQRIFSTLLNIEPNYKKDLIAALNFFRAAFRSIQTQTENEGFEGAGGGLPDDNCETPFDDVALYTLDCAFTLSVLLDVCPAVRPLCGEIKLAQSIANFYDNTLSFLYKNIYLINDSAKSLMWLNQARLPFLQAFRSIAYSYVEEVLSKPKVSILATEEFIGLLTECLSEQTFVIDYERHYSVALDMEILKQACEELDTFKANFVVQGYQKEAETAAKETINNIQNLITNQELTNSNNLVSEPEPKRDEVKVNEDKRSSERDIELEVTMVLDCLPHLGTGFIRRLISRYDSSEEAIAAVLENNLPPDLAQADQTEVYIPPDPQDKVYEQTGVKHFNVYDGDKYDIMTQDNPQCIIKQGKGFPNAPQNATQLLDDKSDLAAIKHRYQEYSLVTEDPEDDDEYNDEYDDSYEALLESETRVVKSKDLKKVLADVADESEEESESEEEDDSSQANDNQRNKNLNFCENPEEVRARYEARRQAKWAKKGNFVPQQQDVVGRSKGQGQEKEVLRNRQKKEANKSSRANHNRKAGAAFKQSKGMF